MNPLPAHQIRGNWATLLLPIGEGDAIDYGALADEIDALIGFGVDGIYSNGTAGEFYTLTEAEFDRTSELLADRCNRRSDGSAGMLFQIGVSHTSPQLSLERLKRAVALAPSAVQVVLPDWYPTTEEENIRFLDRMAEASDPIGLVLYNPLHAKRVLTPEAIGRLSRAVPALVGVKVRDGDETWYEAMRTHCADLSVFVPGHHLATGIRLGAHGSYSNVACLHPGAAQRWYDSMRTEPEAALEVQSRLVTFIEAHIRPFMVEQGYSSPAVDKLVAAIGGWSGVGPRLRWPYRSFSPEHVAQLRKIARTLLPEFFNRVGGPTVSLQAV